MSKLKILPILLLLTLLLSSCLQHKIKIVVNEDGSVDYEYTISGDSADLYDGLTALPQGIPWEIKKYSQIDTTENSTDTSFFYIAKAHFAPGTRLPSGFGLEHLDFASIALELPLSVKRQNLFFLDKYSFELKFPSRRYTELYGNPQEYIPAECSRLENGDSLSNSERQRLEKLQTEGYKSWAAATLTSRFIKSLEQSRKMHPEVKFDSTKIDTAKSALSAYIVAYIAKIDLNQSPRDTDIWTVVFEPGFKLLEEHLNFIGDTTFFLDMRSAGQILSREYDVTSDLSDEAFSIELNLPGELKASSADTIMEENLRWEFNGDEISDSTKTLTAISVIYHYERMYITGGGILLIILVTFFITRKKSKSAPVNQIPNP